MKKFISAALVVAMTAASCANKEDLGNTNPTAPAQPAGDGSVSFVADFAEPIAKAAPSYDADAHAVSVLWELNDKVGVYAGENGPAEFTAQAAGASTTLKGVVGAADTYYAMCPYDENASIAAGQISTSLPATQTATANAFMAHLAVAATTNSSMNFKNVCALVRVYVGCDHVAKIEFKGNAEEVVAGEIIVDAATAEIKAVSNGSDVITITPPNNEKVFDKGAYYFSVLPQKFNNGFSVIYYTKNGNIDSRSTGTNLVDVPRSSLVVGTALTDIAGDGTTEESAFIVANVHDLCCLSEVLITGAENYVKLDADIDMSGVTTWTPINNVRKAANVRKIHFDGQEHTISNFNPQTVSGISGNDKTDYSLFGVLCGSCKDLTLSGQMNQPGSSSTAILASFGGYSGVDITTVFTNVHVSGEVSGKKVIGAMVAESYNAEFINCSVDAEVTATEAYAASFVGRSAGTLTMTSCSANGTLTGVAGKYAYGGLLGGTGGESTDSLTLTMTKCSSEVSLKGDYQVGGLIGLVDNSKCSVSLTDCYSKCELSTVDNYTKGYQFGGLVGVTNGALTATRCYFDGKISVEEGVADSELHAVGGILGLGKKGNDIYVEDCFVLGEVTAEEDYVGGIVGYQSKGKITLMDCYVGAEITCEKDSSYVGGVLGKVNIDDSSDATATLKNQTIIRNCKFGGTLLPSTKNYDPTYNFLYGGSNKLTSKEGSTYYGKGNSSSVTSTDYDTPVKIATQLGWDTTAWDTTAADGSLTLKPYSKTDNQ